VQYKQFTWCQEKDHMGEWGACAAGYQYREHVQCSTKASMRYHTMTCRQGRHCGGAVAQAIRLSEQIDLSQSKDTMKWTSMSMDEVLAGGMEAYDPPRRRAMQAPRTCHS
jgi:hypothetical protein